MLPKRFLSLLLALSMALGVLALPAVTASAAPAASAATVVLPDGSVYVDQDNAALTAFSADAEAPAPDVAPAAPAEAPAVAPAPSDAPAAAPAPDAAPAAPAPVAAPAAPAPVAAPVAPAPAAAAVSTSKTYADLMAAVQGETNANAHYLAFAAQARKEGYPEISNLFTATAQAEAIHAMGEWDILVTMGAVAAQKPVADVPVVETTAQNLQTAINGETYETTTMYPGFAADATAEGNTVVAALFTRTGTVENIHAKNYQDALNNLGNAAYLTATYATVYLCPVCGAVFNSTNGASGRCPVCNTSQGLYLVYKVSLTYNDLMAAVQGETNANAHYLAFAAQAQKEGYPAVANLFTATAAAEAIHASDEWSLLVKMGATAAQRPVADTPVVQTTAENLQTAINGETYETTTMYPNFATDATAEGNTAAANLFTRTGNVEKVHAGNYQDALNNLADSAYLKATYGTVYLCPVCGAIFNATKGASGSCSVCGTAQRLFLVYKVSQTYADLMAAVQGETNANAHYLAFAAKAKAEGYPDIANLFTATAQAEAIHAMGEWDILVMMGATAAQKPVADVPVVQTTAQNLQAAIDGETYETTTMYPGFAADATAEGNTTAANLFTRTGSVEKIHATNYQDALTNLSNAAYLSTTYSTVYLCPVCGAIFNASSGSGSCSVCGTRSSLYVQYNRNAYMSSAKTYADLMAAVQGETNANAHYLAFAAQARKEGYPEISNLFTATAAAESIHASDEWAMLVTMGATAAQKPVVQAFDVKTTLDNLQAAIDGETYETTIMYPGFAADATADGNTAAASSFNRTARVEKVHADNYQDAWNNLNDSAYLKATYGTVYLCPVCGAVFNATKGASGSCSVCGTAQRLFLVYKVSQTYADLMAAVQGETNANAHYLAFAAQARKEGHPEISNLFTATAQAEAIHAMGEWNILVTMGATAAEKPVVQAFTIGTTSDNLLAAISGETYETTIMYPGFATDATNEGNTAAANLFTRTGKVENIHAGNYQDALNNLNDSAYLKATYGTVYLCPVCGAIFNATKGASGSCSVCGTPQRLFMQYVVSQTYANLMAAVQGETNANAHYLAFAAQAKAEGYHYIASLFTATAAAEAIHASDEWALLVKMGATAAERPVADTPVAGNTAENLLAAISGETYETTVMYPGFAADATAEGNTTAASLFKRTGNVENIHAKNYQDALNNLNNAAYLKATFSTVYLCPVCGATFDAATVPSSGRCSVCGTPQNLYLVYVTVLPAPTSITMSAAQTSLNMKVGTKLQLQINISPAGADPSVTWSSSNPAVATVDPVTGLVTALKTGSVRITVKSNANPAVSYMFLVMINA